jgi:hypothetical protein
MESSLLVIWPGMGTASLEMSVEMDTFAAGLHHREPKLPPSEDE